MIAASVYLTLVPQFLAAKAMSVGTMVQMALVHVAVMVAWLGVWSMGLQVLSNLFDPRVWTARINVIGGTVHIALGVRPAVRS